MTGPGILLSEAFVYALAPPLVIVAVALADALMLLSGVELGAVHGLDVLAQGARVRVPLRAAGSFANIRFLK